MSKTISGIHHLTAIADDPQKNVDFYCGILGLRLVKQTVNFDDPGTYHLYYGDELGSPGTILTFFPYPGGYRGRRGTGQATTISFSVSAQSLDYWMGRFADHAINFDAPTTRFEEEEVLSFYDPDGLQLELVAEAAAAVHQHRQGGPIPAEHAIRGFHGVTLSVEGYERTASLLTETFGFRLVREEANRFRYRAGTGGLASLVDVLCTPDAPAGRVAVGTVHHVAWRTPTDDHQKAWHEELAKRGFNVTPVMDRNYFRSIYFREPGGVLFEIATDPPGFTVDESPEQLGTHLKLPSWLETRRERIEQMLPPLRPPKG